MARAVIDLLPSEDLVYLGDTARYPYGSRSLDEVAEFSRQIADHLVANHDVKVLVVACNTASAAALVNLSEQVEVPVVGVIEPGVRALLDATVTGHVGIIGTVGTIASGAYQNAVEDLDSMRSGSTELAAVACPGFVEFVERGDFDSAEMHVLAERLLARKVRIGLMPRAFQGEPHLHGFPIGYAYLPTPTLTRGLEILAEELKATSRAA